MARIKTLAPATVGSAADTASDLVSAPPVAPPAGGSPATAVLAALSAEPAGATVSVIAGHAGVSASGARKALLANEKANIATRVKGGRLGTPDTWKPAAGSTAEGGEAEPGTKPGPDPAVTAGPPETSSPSPRPPTRLARPSLPGT